VFIDSLLRTFFSLHYVWVLQLELGSVGHRERAAGLNPRQEGGGERESTAETI
jgi:hypothetical protein